MNVLEEKTVEKIAAWGVAVTGSALLADWIQLLNGIAELLLTITGIATGVFTALYYATKFFDWLELRKHAKAKRTIESETSDL
jgi:hypothetical protein